jgi:hypothetical protein
VRKLAVIASAAWQSMTADSGSWTAALRSQRRNDCARRDENTLAATRLLRSQKLKN